MSSKAFSPAANLLRNSRLMAMPSAVAPPPFVSAQAPPASPYPTVQAITTPRSSAFRGEWGLKRDLPLKTSLKTTYMRYNDLDTIEHMTTFESAHDDVYTVKKWQEMGVALGADLLIPGEHSNSNFSISTVFDHPTKPETYKWRYKGPHVGKMAPTELREYILTSILPRKAEFREFVAARQKVDKIKRSLVKRGLEPTDENIAEVAENTEDVTEVDMLDLRGDRSYLERLVTEFLDLPSDEVHQTHPSAGLYYTRSKAHAANDAEFGPQAEPKIVSGRNLGFQPTAGELAGVGGIVAVTTKGYGAIRNKADRFTVHQYIPRKAYIDIKGRIILKVDEVLSGPDAMQSRDHWNPFTASGTRVADSLRDSPSGRKNTEEVLQMLEKHQMRKRVK